MMRKTRDLTLVAALAAGLLFVAVACGDGENGAAGSSCTVTESSSGTKTLSCGDGTTVTIRDGEDGQDGAMGDDGGSCTITGAGGAYTLECDDGTSEALSSGTDGRNCTITDNDDGTSTLSCSDGTEKTWASCSTGSYRCTPDPLGAGGGGGQGGASGGSVLLEQCVEPGGWQLVETCGVGECHAELGRCELVDGQFRIAGGGDSGRLEVFFGGFWGTVCQDGFAADDNAADVVCREMGFSSGVVVGSATTADGTGSVLIDDVTCTGSEESLFDCTWSGWGVVDCSHTEDVGVTCTP